MINKFFGSEKVETHKVYGVSNEYVDSYIQRPSVDKAFVKGLKTNKHIIVYGASKQGKTSLTNEHMKDSEFVRIDCSPNSELLDIYKSILRQLKIEFEESKTENTSIKGDGKFATKAKLKFPIIGEKEIGFEAGGSIERSNEKTYTSVEYNLSLAQDISEILERVSFTGRIILENFHYLDEDQQKQIAFDLRVFEDKNILFVILGIWRERNRLPQFNGDLLDRLVEIPVEPWKYSDFLRVIAEGEPILNVSFEKLKKRIIETSCGSVGVLQELLKNSCYSAGVEETQDKCVQVVAKDLDYAISNQAYNYASRHLRCIESFIEQRVKAKEGTPKPLRIPYYFMKAVFLDQFPDISEGINRKKIQTEIQKIHHRPDDVRSSDLSNFLYNIVPMQLKKGIIPPVFDYDRSTQRLRVIDSTFYFFINYCNKESVCEMIDSMGD